jgi:microcin C transport system permease protein
VHPSPSGFVCVRLRLRGWVQITIAILQIARFRLLFDFNELPLFGKIKDYLWHKALPLTALTVGGFATLTMLTKNSFLEEFGKPFVITARAKGLPERRVLYGHVFRNAMLIVIAGFPAAFVSILYSGARC